MKGLSICLLFAVFSTQILEAENTSAPKVEFPSEFVTKKGDKLNGCRVTRVETDALIIQHSGGVAKVSFFDVSKAIQNKYDFDPVAAMEKYHRDRKIQKELKWHRFWEAQKYKTEVAEKEDQEKFHEHVKSSWIPIEASVVKLEKNGAFVTANRITFVKTKKKSTLGFEIDGPLRKTLVRMKPNVIFIQASGIGEGSWRGYLNPVSYGSRTSSFTNVEEVPMYHAVARTDFK